MSKTTILYKDIAPGAEEDAEVTAKASMPDSDPSLLPAGVTPERCNTLELNYWILDGKSTYTEIQKKAFWSTEMTGQDGRFSNEPVIEIAFDKQYSSVGLTLVFDKAGNEYCSEVHIQWYQGESVKEEKDFYPDAATYFCNASVSAYDRIVITLKSTMLPYRYAKLERIIFGIYRTFDMFEIRSASIVNQTSLLSTELPISTMSLKLDSKENIDFMFQLKQPMEVRNDDNLISVYYIDTYSRASKSIYDIDCHDAFGILDETPFSGGVYTNRSAKEILLQIIGEDFEVEFEEGLADMNLTGIIRSGTKRQAAQQVLFAWGCCAATDGGEAVRVFLLSDDATEIGRDRTYTGVTVETASIVTEVQVTAHTYTKSNDGSIEIGGEKYSDVETVFTVKNPNVTATDKQNVIEITDGTLVSSDIGQSVAQRVYDYYLKRNTNRAKIVWKGELLGDCVTLPNAWGEANTGNLSKMEIRLSNTVAASCEAVGT